MSGIVSGIPRSEHPRLWGATAARSGTQGCQPTGHRRMGPGDWAIPQMFCVCAMRVPGEGAHLVVDEHERNLLASMRRMIWKSQDMISRTMRGNVANRPIH